MRDRLMRIDWFKGAVKSYQSTLTAYAKGIVKSFEVAREVVQETFMKLWSDDVQDSQLSLKVWLFKTCRNHCIDLLRKEGRVSQLLEEHQENLPCPKELPSEMLEKKQMHECILEKMKDLPEHHQEILRLKFQQDLSYKEISEITGYTLNHVGVLLHQAVLNLRASLAKGGRREA